MTETIEKNLASPKRVITLGELIFKAKLTEDGANAFTDGAPSIPFDEAVKRDGGIALACLTKEELELIFSELHRSGLPPDAPHTAEVLSHLIWTFTASSCPDGDWYDAALHSSLAAAHLLCLIQDAWGFDEAQERQKEIEAFANKLGVPSKIEH